MQHTTNKPKQKDYRTVVLPSGKGLMFNRLTDGVMGICGSVDAVGCLHIVSGYRFYFINSGQLQRRVRKSER